MTDWIETLMPFVIILAFIGILYAKISYVRQFVAWAWNGIIGKLHEKKEEVKEKISESEYHLAFKYG